MAKTTKKEPKVNELFDKLKEGVQAVYSSDTWKELLLFQSKFHNYSFNNIVLISMQCPEATRVASYKTWQELGRQVVKGEKGIKIMAPHQYKVNTEKEEEETTKLGFHQTSVFDISQTDGEELPTLCPELKGDTQGLRDFYGIAKNISPVMVQEETIKGGAKGYYHLVEDYIAIKKGMAAQQKCKTLIHEIAHAMLHKIGNDRASQLTSNDKEVEAEGTAFVVLSYFGFDTSEYSFPYVASWNGSENLERIQKAGVTIQKIAQEIIEKLQTEMDRIQAA